MGKNLTVRSFTVMLGLALGAVASAPGGVQAVQPDEVLADQALETRARAISHDLRCLVCQNQSIDDSDAPLARDLRLLVRERLVAGDSDAQVQDFLVARFGEFVLLKPRLSGSTLLLWLMPLLLLAGAGVVIAGQLRAQRSRAAPAKALTAEEERSLNDLMRAERNTDNDL